MKQAWDKIKQFHSQQSARPIEIIQTSWLLDCLKRNQDCAYGRQYQFSEIHTIEDYQSRVPVVDYDSIRTWVEKMADHNIDNLLFMGGVIAFEKTSGTTSRSKLIPYSTASLTDFQNAILPWLASVAIRYDLNENSAYWAISPAMRTTQFTHCGIPIGLPDAAYLGRDVLNEFRQLSAVPEWISEITDLKNWQIVTLYWLIRCFDLGLISVWSPTFLLMLLDALETYDEQLLILLKQGGEVQGFKLAADNLAAERLKQYQIRKNLQSLWPQLKLISCWADASSKRYFKQLQSRMPWVEFQPKGLLSTEGVVTIPNGKNDAVLAINSGFYEFLDEQGDVLLFGQLMLGQIYEVVMTSSGGLYRYKTGDQVRCKGYAAQLPILEFVGRTGVSSDLVGEKLSEAFVMRCLKDIDEFCMLMPCDEKIPCYTLILDKKTNLSINGIQEKLENLLRQNIHYDYARKLGQLGVLRIRLLENPVHKYLQYNLKKGINLGDSKIPVLCKYNWLIEVDKQL